MIRFNALAPLTLLAALAVTTLGTGCTFNDPLETKGANGVAEFSYLATGCLLTCSTTQYQVLQGSSVTAQAQLSQRTDEPFILRVKDSAIGTLSHADQSCSCGDSNSSASVDCNASCPGGKTKSVQVSVDVQTTAAGDTTLELVDAKGLVVDSAPMTVHAAAKINASVSSEPHGGARTAGTAGVDGAYTVKVGNDVIVSFGATDTEGNNLIFTQHGIVPTYSDPKVLSVTSDVIDQVFSGSGTEPAVAHAAGNATISLKAQGASTDVKFHVVK